MPSAEMENFHQYTQGNRESSALAMAFLRKKSSRQEWHFRKGGAGGRSSKFKAQSSRKASNLKLQKRRAPDCQPVRSAAGWLCAKASVGKKAILGACQLELPMDRSAEHRSARSCLRSPMPSNARRSDHGSWAVSRSQRIRKLFLNF